MPKLPKKFGWRVMELALATTVTLSVLAGLIVFAMDWLADFPDNYPDKTLAIEAWVSAFLHDITLPIKLARLSLEEPDTKILMPVYGMRTSQVSDTWGAPRDGERSHEGQDIFADRGTPVFSGTDGYVTRIGNGDLGGNFVNVTGAGRVRYYYAHLDRVAAGLKVGQKVTTDTVIGFVGNTGNAITTPPHLHLGMYLRREALNPFPLLTNR